MNKEQRKKQLLKKIEEATSMEEIRNLQEEIKKIDEEPEENEIPQDITPEEERNLIRNTSNNTHEARSIGVSQIFNGGTEMGAEQRKTEENKKIIEERAKDLKSGKSIKMAFSDKEERSITVNGGTILVPKKYKNSIEESFNSISGMVDQLNTIPLNGGESYDVPFEKTYGEGDYTTEGGEYKDIDVETDYVETGRAKITAYAEVTKEVKKLPAANYLALVNKRVIGSIKKKIGAQSIVGAGTTNTITGIYNANEKVMPGDSDIEIEKIDADTLNDITFAYGGDEDVEAPQTLVLTKADLKAFAKVKAADGRPIYKITKKGTTGTIAYTDEGLSVPFVINSACNSLSSAKTTAGKFTMIYGCLEDFELPVFSDIDVQESSDYQFKKGIIAYRADVIIGGTVSKYNGFVRVKKATPAAASTQSTSNPVPTV